LCRTWVCLDEESGRPDARRLLDGPLEKEAANSTSELAGLDEEFEQICFGINDLDLDYASHSVLVIRDRNECRSKFRREYCRFALACL